MQALPVDLRVTERWMARGDDNGRTFTSAEILRQECVEILLVSMEVNLLDHLIAGPFDFKKDPMWAIPDGIWETLINRATELEIEPAKINCNRIDSIATTSKRTATVTNKQGKRQKN